RGRPRGRRRLSAWRGLAAPSALGAGLLLAVAFGAGTAITLFLAAALACTAVAIALAHGRTRAAAARLAREAERIAHGDPGPTPRDDTLPELAAALEALASRLRERE